MKYPIITLCGSTRFKDEFMNVQKKLTLNGNIVISVGLFGHSGDSEVWSEGTKTMLDDMHKAKIDMADKIFVINKNGYIGDSTKSEIEYAKVHGKEIEYLEPPSLSRGNTVTCRECGEIFTYSDKDIGLYAERSINGRRFEYVRCPKCTAMNEI